MNNRTILIVDDEPAIVELLTYNLEKEHYHTLVARNGKQALQIAGREKPDLVILDLMLPEVDGLEVCRTLRQESEIPIIMLTARDEEIDRVLGLELGADDYVVKPFSMRELLARVRSVLRRTTSGADTLCTPLKAGSYILDEQRHEVTCDGKRLSLSALEFNLLKMFMTHPGQVLTREQLLSRVWGYDFYGDTRAVDTAVKRLRAKIRADIPDWKDPFLAIRGVGYKFKDED